LSEVAQKPTRWGRLLLLGGILLGGAFLVRSFGLQEVLSLHNIVRLKAWIEEFGPLAPLVFIAGYILAVIFFIPGLPITVLGGVAAATWWPEPGVRGLGVGLLALTWWLARHDVARRTVRQRGLTRFMAVCLLGGYAWLGVGGAIAAVTGVAMPGLLYDAMLHAVFIGFVISMVFAHAPVIFPAVLGLPLEYRPAFYLHVGVLHVSLILRVVGDLVDSLGRWRVWGGMLNAVALLLFMFNTGRSMASRGNHGDAI